MSKLQEIKTAQLIARKTGEKNRASLLTTIIGEAEMVGKTNGNRESTDEEVLQVLKKFEKGQNENIQIYTGKPLRQVELEAAKIELNTIREFLPQKLKDEQVKQDISFIMSEGGHAFEQKNLGKVVPILKAQYGDQFDGQQVSAIFKGMM